MRNTQHYKSREYTIKKENQKMQMEARAQRGSVIVRGSEEQRPCERARKDKKDFED